MQPTPATHPRSKPWMFWAVFALFIITFAAFLPALRCGFVTFDDPAYVTQNPCIQAGTLWQRIVAIMSTRVLELYHPLGPLTYLFDYGVFGLNPAGFHATSVIIHCITVVTFFLLLREMTGSAWRSWVGAAIFAIHPLRVESVVWIAERKDVLSVLFALVTLWAYAKYAARPSWRRYLLLFPPLLLSLLAKPLVITMPILLLILDFWPLGRYARPMSPVPTRFAPATLSRLIAEKIPLTIVLIVWLFITVPRPEASAVVNFDFAGYSTSPECELAALPAWRLVNVPVSYVRYLYKHLDVSHLCCFYPPVRWSVWTILGSGLLLSLITLGAIRTATKYPWLLAGWMWYLVTLVPVIGIAKLSGYSLADRYTYLADAGLLMMAAWSIPDGWLRSRALRLGFIGLLVILMCATWRQVGYWRDSEALERRAIDVAPGNEEAHRALGMTLWQKGNAHEAIAHLREAARLSPRGTVPLTCLGIALAQHGEKAEATQILARAVEIDPAYPESQFYLAVLLADAGQFEQAVPHLQRIIQSYPNSERAFAQLGLTLSRLNRLDAACEAYLRALTINPRLLDVAINLADVLAKQGKDDQAILVYQRAVAIAPSQAMDEFREALKHKPDNALLHDALGMALMSTGSHAEALREFQQALRLAPDMPQIRKHHDAAEAAIAPPSTRMTPP